MIKIKIHLPSNDELEIIKTKSKYRDQLSRVVSEEIETLRLIKELANRMIKTANEKRSLVKIEEKLLDDLEVAKRNPVCQIDQEEINSVEKSSKILSQSLENQQILADAFLDLSSVMKSFLSKKDAYSQDFAALVSYEEKWQKEAYTLMKKQNKFVEESKLIKHEEKIHDLEGKITRTQRQCDFKLNSLIEDAKSLDLAWSNVKQSIRKYGW